MQKQNELWPWVILSLLASSAFVMPVSCSEPGRVDPVRALIIAAAAPPEHGRALLARA